MIKKESKRKKHGDVINASIVTVFFVFFKFKAVFDRYGA